MLKKNLIARAEKWHAEAKRVPLMGYPRKGQDEILEMSTAIIKTLCEAEQLTPWKAKQALKMAADILDEEMERDTML